MSLRMSVTSERLCVCRLPRSSNRESWIGDLTLGEGSFFSATRTVNELSVVCAEGEAPEGAEVECGWRAMKVEGALDFSLTGVLASIASPLAEAGVSIFVVSTYETDYILVKEASLERAVTALEGAGHAVLAPEAGGGRG
jgi:uncharacterized protein